MIEHRRRNAHTVALVAIDDRRAKVLPGSYTAVRTRNYATVIYVPKFILQPFGHIA